MGEARVGYMGSFFPDPDVLPRGVPRETPSLKVGYPANRGDGNINRESERVPPPLPPAHPNIGQI